MAVSHTAVSLNLSTLEKTGMLEQGDYAKVARILTEALSDLRIQRIRQRLALVPHEFTKYEQYARENFDRQNRPTVDPDMVFDMGIVAVTLAVPIRACFFPQFLREYECPDILNRMIIESTDDGYTVLPTTAFQSLLEAAHQVEVAVKQLYAGTTLAADISPTIEVECEWMLPPTLSLSPTDEMRLAVTVFIICD
jgi:hypothetical protein